MVRMRSRRGRRRAAPAPRSAWRRLWDGVLTVAILGLLVVLAARLNFTEPHALAGHPAINDGDSLTMGSERIRLLGIDAPELSQMCSRDGADFPCGRRSREALVALVGGRQVECSGRDRDRYGRLLATCSAGGTELNSGQVAAGWAVAYGGYAAEEEAARSAGLGIWAGRFDKPRDWREMHGGLAETEHALPDFLGWLKRLLRLS